MILARLDDHRFQIRVGLRKFCSPRKILSRMSPNPVLHGPTAGPLPPLQRKTAFDFPGLSFVWSIPAQRHELTDAGHGPADVASGIERWGRNLDARRAPQ